MSINSPQGAHQALFNTRATRKEPRAWPIGDIHVGDRLRAPSDAKVKELADSMAEIGLITPITVRRGTSADFDADGDELNGAVILVAGNGRLKAAKHLGWENIECRYIDGNALDARLVEIDENLIRSELTVAECALHLTERKRVYELLHPETKVGASGRGRAKVRQNGEANDRFTKDTAKKTGKSERTIQREVERAKALGPDTLAQVRGTCLDKGAELDALAKLPEEERAKLIERAVAGEKVSAIKPQSGSGSPGFDAACEWAKRLGREVTQLGSGGFSLSMPDGHPGVCHHSLKSLKAALKEIEEEKARAAAEADDAEVSGAAAEAQPDIEYESDRAKCTALYLAAEVDRSAEDTRDAILVGRPPPDGSGGEPEPKVDAPADTVPELPVEDQDDEVEGTVEEAEAELKRLKDLKAKLKDNDEAQDKFDAQESMKVFAAFKAACSKLLPGMNSDHLQEAIDFFAEAVEVPANELMPDLSIVQFDLKIAKKEVTVLKRKIAGKLPPRESRAAAWSRLTSEATDAIEQLMEYQSEFEEAKDGQPDSLRDGPFAQKCEEICGIDLQGALETLQEAEGAEVPLGFGRD